MSDDPILGVLIACMWTFIAICAVIALLGPPW